MKGGILPVNKKAIESVALSIRALTMDAIQRAKSGHPGLPLGCAELGSIIYGEVLNHFPEDPEWINRDRFILSAGHGSMLLYSLLHLSGYNISLEDIKNFRQIGSLTPGHPEHGKTPGVEITTGPLGQGIANAVGLAIAEKTLSAHFNTDKHKIINHYTYVLASDGDIMEGISSEAASLAGHLGLGKIIVYYDSNRITIEGSTDLTFSEDVGKRFEGFGWHIQSGSAYDITGIISMTEKAKQEENMPSIIILDSVIAKGSVNLEGSSKSHGAPLGEDEVKATKMALGIPVDSFFYIHPEALLYFKEKQDQWRRNYEEWKLIFSSWKKENPELYEKWQQYFIKPVPLSDIEFSEFTIGEKITTRGANGKYLNDIALFMTNLVGGSADLGSSNKTLLKKTGDFSKEDAVSRNIHFGVREHSMAAISNGIYLHGGLRPYCATFLVFSDYMRPSMRLSCLMKLPVIYIFSHDSVYVGEDGPTHQPIEHISALRSLPGMIVLRPGDAQEAEVTLKIAIERTDGPTSIILTRQEIEVYSKDDPNWKETIKRGAYIVKETDKTPDIVIVATGSEVELALKAARKRKDLQIRVVSMSSIKLFLSQQDDFKNRLIPQTAKRIFIEAGIRMGWMGLPQNGDSVISIERFGESGPGAQVASHLGLNEDSVLKVIDENI